MFGPKGLLRVTQSIDADPSESFIQSLLEKISEKFAGNLSEDDVTVMLLKPNAVRPPVRFGQKLKGFLRMLGATLRALDPRAERPPLPDLKLPNIGGAVIPSLAKRWRPTSPLKTSRPSRQPIP